MLNVLKEPIFVLYVLILLKTRVSRTYVSSRKKTGRALFNYWLYYFRTVRNDDYSLHSIDDALCGFPQLKLDDPTPVYHGKQIKSDLTGQVAIYDNQNHLLAIYESTGQGYLKNVRGLWWWKSFICQLILPCKFMILFVH